MKHNFAKQIVGSLVCMLSIIACQKDVTKLSGPVKDNAIDGLNITEINGALTTAASSSIGTRKGSDVSVISGQMEYGKLNYAVTNFGPVTSPSCKGLITYDMNGVFKTVIVDIPSIKGYQNNLITRLHLSTPIDLPLSEGIVPFTIIIDYQNQVVENNETNNTFKGEGVFIF
jgi:hypothetical protein